jgi:hypothetical protein
LEHLFEKVIHDLLRQLNSSLPSHISTFPFKKQTVYLRLPYIIPY